MRTAILIGHGTFDANAQDYKKFIDDFTNFANKNKVDQVIISGDEKINPRLSDSESAFLKKQLLGKLDKKIKVAKETKSLNALQSIKNTASMIKPRDHDDITVFCNSTIAVKVMWFIQHYWFGMGKEEIEKDALNFVATHYSKKNGMEDMGKWIGVTGVHYKNVEVHPCFVKASVHSAIAQQLVSLVDVASLYNEPLQKEMVEATKEEYGLKG